MISSYRIPLFTCLLSSFYLHSSPLRYLKQCLAVTVRENRTTPIFCNTPITLPPAPHSSSHPRPPIPPKSAHVRHKGLSSKPGWHVAYAGAVRDWSSFGVEVDWILGARRVHGWWTVVVVDHSPQMDQVTARFPWAVTAAEIASRARARTAAVAAWTGRTWSHRAEAP